MKDHCDTCGQPHSRCNGHKGAGPCGRWPTRGAEVCRSHGAGNPQVRALAAVREEVRRWAPSDVNPDIDPGSVLLMLVAQAIHRAEDYARELSELVDEEGFRKAMVGETWIPSEHGSYQSGEYIRSLAALEAQERDRAAGFAAKAVAAGLARRQVELAERQGQLIANVLRAVLNDDELGLSDEQRRMAPGVARRHLASVG